MFAHSAPANSSLYNNAWSTVRHRGDYRPGVGMNESRYWHNRVYSGYSDINSMLPEEIGHAAAYEGYRHFLHFSGTLYGPLGSDPEAQREAFVGWTIGEGIIFVITNLILCLTLSPRSFPSL
jgi:hypothetical protein